MFIVQKANQNLMNIDVQQFQTCFPHSETTEQLQKSYASLQHKYTKLLAQFSSYKQSSITSYQKVHDQLEKSNSHNEKLIKKLQKKYQNILHDERTKSTKNLENLRNEFQKERSNLKQIISSKNQTIEKFSQLLHRAEQQKSQIIQENTQSLINIVKSQENCLQMKKYSHTELMKMYQFLLEENNCLKKQLTKVQIPLRQQRNNKKTKTDKNLTQIVYTQQSDKAQSYYESILNPGNMRSNQRNVRRNEPIKSKEHSESLNMNVSVVGSQYVSKPSSNYKQNTTQNTKNKKVNSSYRINEISQISDDKIVKKKDFKKITKTSQNKNK